jgi:hypothetical protein
MLFYFNLEIMQKSEMFYTSFRLFPVFIFLIFSFSLSGQDKSTGSAPLPEAINKIVSVSCMPCHSSKGGLMSRTKLNFSEWTNYSAEKQEKKAKAMYKMLKKSKMPPEEARENNPAIIPTAEQIDTIKTWADSF